MDTGRYAYKVLTKEEYEEKWGQRWKLAEDENVLGYGPENPYIPPLTRPTWLLSVFDRHVIV